MFLSDTPHSGMNGRLGLSFLLDNYVKKKTGTKDRSLLRYASVLLSGVSPMFRSHAACLFGVVEKG
jgi:hypothetical protein